MNWRQLQAIFWLRWRLTRNQFRRGGQVNAVLSVIALVMLVTTGMGLGVGGVALGWFLGAKAAGPVLLLVWDGVIVVFLMFWLGGLMAEIQRAESIDLTKLMHLPVTLPQVFTFNYVASHFTLSLMVFLPALLGLCAGQVLGGGSALVLMAPLLLSFIFMVTAWTYCLRGWLTGLMINRRRRRAIVVWVTIVFVALCQLPNLVLNSALFRKRIRQVSGSSAPARAARAGGAEPGSGEGSVLAPGVVEAHLALPPGWVGYGAMTLKGGNVLPALGGIAGGCLIGCLGLMRAYRVTVRFYQAAEGGGSVTRRMSGRARRRGRLLVERRVPWVAEDTAGLALATFRSLLRSPELKMAAIMPVVMGAVMGSMFVARKASRPPEVLSGFVVTMVVGFAVFCLVPTMSNVFGLDRDGFRALVLLPTRRDKILLAKNLAFFPFVAVVALVMLVPVKFLLGLSWWALAGGVLRVPLAFLLFSLLTNAVSILAPYRLAPGTLQSRKLKPTALLAVLGSMVMLPVVAVPLLIPVGLGAMMELGGWGRGLAVDLLASAALVPGAVWLYRGLLPLQGRWLQRREQAILREVTQETE